jgi:hypothetical protein
MPTITIDNSPKAIHRLAARLAPHVGLPPDAEPHLVQQAILKLAKNAREAEARARLRTPSERAEVRARLRTYREKLGVATDDEVLPAVEKLVADAPRVEKELAEMQAQAAARASLSGTAERERLFKQGFAEGKITPAIAAVMGAWEPSSIRAFLAAAPRVIPRAVNQPKLGDAKVRRGGEPTLTHDGKKWAELNPSERQALKKSDIDHYNAMRREVGLE